MLSCAGSVASELRSCRADAVTCGCEPTINLSATRSPSELELAGAAAGALGPCCTSTQALSTTPKLPIPRSMASSSRMLCPKAAQQLGGVAEGASMPLTSTLAHSCQNNALVSHRYTSLHFVYDRFNGTARCDGKPARDTHGGLN